MKLKIAFKWFLKVGLYLAGVLYLGILTGSIYEAVVFPRSPQKVTLARAVEMDLLNEPAFLVFDQALYVSITDAAWECASVKQSGYKVLRERRSTDAVFSDASKTAVVFYQRDGFHSCEDLKASEIVGVLQRVYTRPVEYQSDASGRVVIGKDADALVYGFCTHCTPDGAVGIPIVGALLPFALWFMIKRWKTA